MTSKSRRKEKKRRLKPEVNARIFEITRPEFIERVVYPVASRGCVDAKLSGDCKASLVPNGSRLANRHATVSYGFGDEVFMYGKVHSSEELARHGFQVAKGLWENGFGKGSPDQVPQPLAYLPEHRLLLMSAAEGAVLGSFIGQDNPEVRVYVRQAARWLVQLHGLPLRIGRPETSSDSVGLVKLGPRLAKAVANAPHERERLIEMAEALYRTSARGLVDVPAVQSHGDFHSGHIHVNGGKITAIDFGGSRPADPARDLAKFLCRLRVKTFIRTGTAAWADAPTQVFLDEYLSHRSGNAKNLAVHWAALLLRQDIIRHVRRYKKYQNDQPRFEKVMQFYEREFESALSGKFLRAR